MCGLAGFAATRELNPAEDQAKLARMLDAMAHRGPDDRGSLFTSQVALGHNRLSIIDLSPLGRQPMGNSQTQVVYNGEIYNFAKLRNQLIAAGHRFQSRTD